MYFELQRVEICNLFEKLCKVLKHLDIHLYMLVTFAGFLISRFQAI